MAISGDRLRSVDEQLAGLGRSDDQIEAVLARFEDREPEDLGAVDAQLAALLADVEQTAGPLGDVEVEEGASTSSAAQPPVAGGELSHLSEEALFGDELPNEDGGTATNFAALFGEDEDEDDDQRIGAEEALAASLESDATDGGASALLAEVDVSLDDDMLDDDEEGSTQVSAVGGTPDQASEADLEDDDKKGFFKKIFGSGT